MHAYAPMKKLMELVHLGTAIVIEAKQWNGTVRYKEYHGWHGVNEIFTAQHFKRTSHAPAATLSISIVMVVR